MSSNGCTDMINLSTSTYLQFSLFANSIVTLIAIPLLICANYQLWRMNYIQLFHVNFKIILQMHLFGFFLHCFGRIALHSIDLFNYNTKEPCDMIPNIYRCFILRLMYNSGLWITNSSSLPLIIERFIATKKSSSYENSSIFIGIFLALLQLLIASIPLGFLYSNTHFDGATMMFYCVVQTAKASAPYAGQISGCISICLQIGARFAYNSLYDMNKKLRLKHMESTLSDRYQLEQNLRSIEFLKVFSSLSTIYIILQNFSFIIVLKIGSALQPQHYFATTEITGSYQVYAIICVLVMWRKIVRIRKKVGDGLTASVKVKPDEYFEHFRQQIS